MTVTSPQGFYCPTCNKSIISPYNVSKCPDCGSEVMLVKYTITEDEHGGKYEVKLKQEHI